MRATRPLTITLPEEMARAVKARVASGAYASDSEVIREGLRALIAQEQAVERWLASEGVARFDAHVASPDHSLSAEEARARLRAHIARRTVAETA
jgi:antitoxin ParD1/3/4